MSSFKSIVLIAAAFTIGVESSAVPAVAAAPLVAPAAVGYAHSVPQNLPPFASQVSVVNRAISSLVAAPVAAPLAAPVPAAPYIAGPVPYAAGFGHYITGPAPYIAGPAPYTLPAAYAAAPAGYAGPFPDSAPFLRAPYFAPAYVR